MDVSKTTHKLNDGNEIPVVGLGVFKTPPGSVAYNAVAAALKCGYRHIDTAALYRNEADVGKAVRDSGVPREDIWITTKLWAMGLSGDGYSYAMQQAEESLRKLGTYIDLYLIHSPHHPSERLNMWRALEDLQKQGKVRSIGVSNYGQHHIEEILSSRDTSVTPAVNQVELHPYLLREDLCKYCASKGIKIQAWAPLAKAKKMDEPIIQSIAKAHGRTPAQVLVRFSIQKGYIPLPKSERPGRIEENAQAFGFELTAAEMKSLESLDRYMVLGWDPVKMP